MLCFFKLLYDRHHPPIPQTQYNYYNIKYLLLKILLTVDIFLYIKYNKIDVVCTIGGNRFGLQAVFQTD